MTDDNVTYIEQSVRLRDGENAFLACPCSPDEATVVPVVLLVPQKAIITALVCTECGAESTVINGIIQRNE